MPMYGIKGFADAGDPVPISVYQVVAEDSRQALDLLRQSGAVGMEHLGEPVAVLHGQLRRPVGVHYAGPWPWQKRKLLTTETACPKFRT